MWFPKRDDSMAAALIRNLRLSGVSSTDTNERFFEWIFLYRYCISAGILRSTKQFCRHAKKAVWTYWYVKRKGTSWILVPSSFWCRVKTKHFLILSFSSSVGALIEIFVGEVKPALRESYEFEDRGNSALTTHFCFSDYQGSDSNINVKNIWTSPSPEA